MEAVLQLPGGLETGAGLSRVAHLRAPTGGVERALAACAAPEQVLPRTVSAVIAAAVERIGAVELTPEVAGRLAVGDRIYLMLQLAIRYVGDLVWLSPVCGRCSATFDIPIERSKLPVRTPDQGYPTCTSEAAGCVVELRTPCGDDQAFIAETRPEDPERALLARCVRKVDGLEPGPEYLRDLSDDEIASLVAALERVSPDVECSVDARCPDCQSVQRIEVEPYWTGDASDGTLERQVHALALHYHWSEPDILRLPSSLRRRYCGLIDQERGARG